MAISDEIRPRHALSITCHFLFTEYTTQAMAISNICIFMVDRSYQMTFFLLLYTVGLLFINIHMPVSQLTIYGCSKVFTPLGESCENVGKLSCCNIYQESFKNVATMLPQNVVRQHLHNIIATLINFDNFDIHNVLATFLQYGKIRVDHIRTCFRKQLTE